MLELLSAVGSIVLADLVLSGDNALVIGAAAAGLPGRQRWAAILAGGAGAIVLRIAFAFAAYLLLQLPWLQAIGGLLLLIIAIRLLADRQHKPPEPVQEQRTASAQKAQTATRFTSRSFFSALLTILVADVTMSLDNVLTVGALSQGDLLVLSLGLVLSIIVLLLGGALVATLMQRLPWLLDIAALVLAWTGANMLLHDMHLGNILDDYAWTAIAVPAASLGIVLVADLLLYLRGRKLVSAPHTP
jgi:YjbE family integral membrane protein